MGKRRKSKAKKRAASVKEVADAEYTGLPHSFVFSRGDCGRGVKQLVLDLRRVLEPFTASQLKVRRQNVLKDFVAAASLLHVTHFAIFTRSEQAVYLRLVRLPHGPTLTFKVEEYSLSSSVISTLKRHHTNIEQYQHHPLLIMNDFPTEQGIHIKLMGSMFQNLFPSINVNNVELEHVTRCLLLHYNRETDCVELRHYHIGAVACGASRAVSRLEKKNRALPDMSGCRDIADFILRGAQSESALSEGELDQVEVNLPQDMPGAGNKASGRSAIRLTELGPRIILRLVKAEEGQCGGEVLYHRYISRTPEEVAALKASRKAKKSLKEERKRVQLANVERKLSAKTARSEAERKRQKTTTGLTPAEAGEEDKPDSETEADYYRQYVAAEPPAEFFMASDRGAKRGSTRDPATDSVKKRKSEELPEENSPALSKSSDAIKSKDKTSTNSAKFKKATQGTDRSSKVKSRNSESTKEAVAGNTEIAADSFFTVKAKPKTIAGKCFKRAASAK